MHAAGATGHDAVAESGAVEQSPPRQPAKVIKPPALRAIESNNKQRLRSPCFKFGLPVPVVIDRQWRMVGELLVLVDRRRQRLGSDSRRSDVIVDTPTDILGIRLPPV